MTGERPTGTVPAQNTITSEHDHAARHRAGLGGRDGLVHAIERQTLRDEGVEVGVHEASQEVDVASATPTLGALAPYVTAGLPQADSEAII